MNVIALHTQHDAGLAVAVDGELVFALELERLFEERYYTSPADPGGFEAAWARALSVTRETLGIERYDIGITSWVPPSRRALVEKLVTADRWTKVDHHRAHGLAGLHESGFGTATVVSFDGGGNDGTFNIYRGRDRELTPVARIRLNLGTPYRLLAITMPEVTGGRQQPRCGHLSLAGKLMGYSALGQAQPEWAAALHRYYTDYQDPGQALFSLGACSA
jgi:carbamoyltransferase